MPGHVTEGERHVTAGHLLQRRCETVTRDSIARSTVGCYRKSLNLISNSPESLINYTLIKMDVSEEPIRHIMLYEFKKSNSAVETTQNIQGIYGAESLNERKCRRWFQKFRSGDYSLSDSPCSSRPVEFNDDLLLAALDEDYAVTVELVQKCDLTHLTVHCHLQELGKVLELGKCVPHDLREANLRARVHICTSLLYLEHSSPLLSKIVTGDERWIFYKNVKCRRQ
ncbi:histone-lysine N-methyltransferase SETMAR-like isoform X2 [Tachypleus tridentatus]|uniref:histone-lysine N-methyltransferase SETMAR-like isoform X2 n=1 Tax=Tachypleus tridentatus TaxID=6853 RepID=UPI003FD4B6A8